MKVIYLPLKFPPRKYHGEKLTGYASYSCSHVENIGLIPKTSAASFRVSQLPLIILQVGPELNTRWFSLKRPLEFDELDTKTDNTALKVRKRLRRRIIIRIKRGRVGAGKKNRKIESSSWATELPDAIGIKDISERKIITIAMLVRTFNTSARLKCESRGIIFPSCPLSW